MVIKSIKSQKKKGFNFGNSRIRAKLHISEVFSLLPAIQFL